MKQQSEKMKRVWRHNMLMGHARMVQLHLNEIIEADSVSDGTKYFASEMLTHVEDLKKGLKTRIDP